MCLKPQHEEQEGPKCCERLNIEQEEGTLFTEKGEEVGKLAQTEIHL